MRITSYRDDDQPSCRAIRVVNDSRYSQIRKNGFVYSVGSTRKRIVFVGRYYQLCDCTKKDLLDMSYSSTVVDEQPFRHRHDCGE